MRKRGIALLILALFGFLVFVGSVYFVDDFSFLESFKGNLSSFTGRFVGVDKVGTLSIGDSLVITELMLNSGSYLSEDEHYRWIELYNPSDQEINLNNWYFTNNKNMRLTIPSGSIGPGEVKVISPSPSEEFSLFWPSSRENILFVPWNINNFNLIYRFGGDKLTLYSDEGLEVDSVAYSPGVSGWPTIETGVSIYLDKNNLDSENNDLGSNWKNSMLGVDNAISSFAVENISFSDRKPNEVASPGYVEGVSSLSVCGNAKTEYGEHCDDGNLVDNDRCSNSCKLNGLFEVAGELSFDPEQYRLRVNISRALKGAVVVGSGGGYAIVLADSQAWYVGKNIWFMNKTPVASAYFNANNSFVFSDFDRGNPVRHGNWDAYLFKVDVPEDKVIGFYLGYNQPYSLEDPNIWGYTGTDSWSDTTVWARYKFDGDTQLYRRTVPDLGDVYPSEIYSTYIWPGGLTYYSTTDSNPMWGSSGNPWIAYTPEGPGYAGSSHTASTTINRVTVNSPQGAYILAKELQKLVPAINIKTYGTPNSENPPYANVQVRVFEGIDLLDCGNGVLDDGEACDFGDYNGIRGSDNDTEYLDVTDPVYGGDKTVYYCSDSCLSSSKSISGGYCGDGKLQIGSEVCELLEIQDCSTIEGYVGSQSCSNDCSGYGSCVIDQVCGNGVKEDGEQCDFSDEKNDGSTKSSNQTDYELYLNQDRIYYCTSECKSLFETKPVLSDVNVTYFTRILLSDALLGEVELNLSRGARVEYSVDGKSPLGLGLVNITYSGIMRFPSYGKHEVSFILNDGVTKKIEKRNITLLRRSLEKISFRGDNESILFNGTKDVIIGGNRNLSEVFVERNKVQLNLSGTEIEFEHNFTKEKLDLQTIVAGRNDTKFFIYGLNEVKNISFKRNNRVSLGAVCIHDREIFDDIEMSELCDGVNDTYVVLENKTVGRYKLELEGDKIKVDNLFHSGISQVCLENWTCGDWGGCHGGIQYRTCIDLNSCGTTHLKPSETQSCTVSGESGGSGGGGGGSGGSGGSSSGSVDDDFGEQEEGSERDTEKSFIPDFEFPRGDDLAESARNITDTFKEDVFDKKPYAIGIMAVLLVGVLAGIGWIINMSYGPGRKIEEDLRPVINNG